MAKKFAKTRTSLIFKKEGGDLVPLYGDYTITYRKGVEDKGILPNGSPVVRDCGRWVLI
jgi:hypothetical protein